MKNTHYTIYFLAALILIMPHGVSAENAPEKDGAALVAQLKDIDKARQDVISQFNKDKDAAEARLKEELAKLGETTVDQAARVRLMQEAKAKNSALKARMRQELSGLDKKERVIAPWKNTRSIPAVIASPVIQSPAENVRPLKGKRKPRSYSRPLSSSRRKTCPRSRRRPGAGKPRQFIRKKCSKR